MVARRGAARRGAARRGRRGAARAARRGVQLGSHQHAERLNDEELLLARRVGRLEDAQENVGEEDADLRLEMVLEEDEERDEDVERELEHRGDRRDAVLQQRQAEVLPNRPNELLARAEVRSGGLYDREKELQREQLGAQLDRVFRREGVGQRLHGELAERAEDEEGVALHDRHRRRRGAHLEALRRP